MTRSSVTRGLDVARRLLERHAARFAPLITHRVALGEVGDTLEPAQTSAVMTVLVAHNGSDELRSSTGSPLRG